MTLSYSVGNEHSPTDPWGRSELRVDDDGTVHLRHHFSRVRREASWDGTLTAAEELRAVLDRSDFPAPPGGSVPPDTTLARVTVGDASVLAPRGAAGYAELFDALDGIVRQLSDGAVPFPSTCPVRVRNA